MRSIEPGISALHHLEIPRCAIAHLRFALRAHEMTVLTLSHLPESQIRRVTAFTLGFASVARHRVIGPWQAPVAGALRGPEKIGRACETLKRPCAVICDIADEATFDIR